MYDSDYDPYINFYIHRTNRAFTDEGYLQIGIFENNIGKPISNVSIKISPTGDRTQVINEKISDLSGQTSQIDLAAPPIEFSMNPGSNKPYSEYDIFVTAEGYQPTIIEGVQIFPHTIAKQNIFIQPTFQNDSLKLVKINEHTLWGVFPSKLEEDEVKELSPPSRTCSFAKTSYT